MQKNAIPVLSAVAILLAVATGVLFFKYRTTSTNYVEMRAAEESSRSRYDQTIMAIAEIQDSLNAIATGDTNVTMRSGASAELNLADPDGKQALDRIAVLRASILRNKQRIQQLESSIKKSGIKVAGLERMIANLKHSVSQKQDEVALLTSRVGELQTQVAGLETTVIQTQDTVRVKEQVIEEKREALATVYYVVGDKKELTDQGVIEAKGGVLGLGKTILPAATANQTVFTPLDTDESTVIRTSAPKARLVSAQPASSYELVLVDGQMELHILNPEEFRKIKQVVILTA
jgi:uncharacterized coiled-coil protein SlyX